MPMTQIACPQCRRMIQANVEQLFDVTQDPQAKQRLLAGLSNMARCPNCGFHGRLATPIVYHDAEKELLLTYFPPELNTSLNEQERLTGPLIKQVMDRLPAQKRKAYLLSPVANLTYESLIETILGKDGITPEMIKVQQERLGLVERLLQAGTPEIRSELIKQSAALIDEQFFALFGRLLQGAAGSGQESVARDMSALQKQLLEETELGRELKQSVGELETAGKALQEAGPTLTREKLLDLILASPNDARLRAYVSLARAGMDYTFFQTLTDKIDASKGDEKLRLETLRTKLLAYVDEVDKQLEARYKQATNLVEAILKEDDVDRATRDRLGEFTQDAVDISSQMLRQASEKNDYARMGKLQKMLQVLQEASAPPPEVGLIEDLLQAPDDEAVNRLLVEHDALINDQFLEALSGLVSQVAAQDKAASPDAKRVADRLQAVHKIALGYSMKKRMASPAAGTSAT